MHPYKFYSLLVFLITEVVYINAYDLVWPNPEKMAGNHFSHEKHDMIAYASKQGALETVCLIVMVVCAVQWLIGIWVERDKVKPIQLPRMKVRQTNRPADISEEESAAFKQWLEDDIARSYLSTKDQIKKFRAQRS